MNDIDQKMTRMDVAKAVGGLVAIILAILIAAGVGIAGIAALLYSTYSYSQYGIPLAGVLGVLVGLLVLRFLRRGKRRYEFMLIANPAVGNGDERQQLLTLKANSFAGEVSLFYSLGFLALVTFAPSTVAWLPWLIVGQITVFFVARFAAAWHLTRKG